MNKRNKIVWGTTSIICVLLMTRCAIAEAQREKEEKPTAAATAAQTERVDYRTLSVPSGDTSFKSYMDWECITNTRSTQYKMQEQSYTDSTGLRRYKTGEYMVAMGTYYGQVGDRFKITLDSGKTFECVLGDQKADVDTDMTNRYTEMGDDQKNVIEFIVDTDKLPDMTRKMGDISYDGFEGNVKKIERMNE